MTDPMDQPQPAGYGLVVPFIACKSKGGPYDDDSFAAGYHAGQIGTALAALAAVGGDRFIATARTALVSQLELLAMERGFTYMRAVQVAATEQYDARPEWSFVTFSTRPIEEPS